VKPSEKTDVDDRLTAEGEIEMRPKTPLRIVSRGATPVKSALNGPIASTSKTLSRIIQAISTPKKVSGPENCSPLPKLVTNKRIASSVTSTPQKTIAAPIMVASKSSASTPAKAKATPKPILKNMTTLPAATPRTAPMKRELASLTVSLLVSAKKPKSGASLELGKGLLVWAHWRLQYYTAAMIHAKKSKSRDIWQVTPLHRSGSTLDCSVEQLLPIAMLEHGDEVLHMLNRRRYKVAKMEFKRLFEKDGERFVLMSDGTAILLKDVVIDRNLFMSKHKAWKATQSNAASTQDDGNEAIMADEHEDEARYSLTGLGHFQIHNEDKGLFGGLSFIFTGFPEKAKLTSLVGENGGRVCEDFPDDLVPAKFLLISADASNKTAKYYSAIVLGVDLVKPGWIDDCVKKGSILGRTPYLLERQPRTISSRRVLLTDVHMCFVGSKSYKESCEQVASLTHATLVDQCRLATYQDRSVIVVMENAEAIKPRLRATCLANGHLLAEKSWFTDSILQGKVLRLP